MTLRFPRHILLALLLLTAAASAQVQITPVDPNQRLLRAPQSEEGIMAERARRAEQSGDFSRALALWKEVLIRSPWHPEAVQGEARALIVLKQYDEADAFLADKIKRAEFRNLVQSPADPTSRFALTLLRGQVALARGDEAAAQTIWNDALAQSGKSPEAVHVLVLFLQQNRRWEESEKLIRDYRKSEKQPAYMALELANSLRSQMNFAAATEELLLYAQSAPAGWQLAMNYLNQYPDDPAVADKVNAVLAKAAKADRKNGILWRLISGYALKTGDMQESLRAAITADSLAGRDGSIVLLSAGQILADGEATVARVGYQRVLAWKPVPEIAAQAELGLGRCSEILGQWDEAKRAYEHFVARYPKSRESDEARARVAEILLERENNPRAALDLLTTLPPNAALARSRVVLRIGDCHAWMGDFAAAIQSWSDLARPGAAGGEETAAALLRMARANLWRDSTARATLLLDSITTLNPSTTAFNDAVLYQALLEDGGVYRATRAFAEGDYAGFRGDDSSAAGRFAEAADLLKEGRLAEWARYAEAVALRAGGRPRDAITVLDTFLVHYPTSVDVDRAEYLRALIRTEDLHDDKTALAELEHFLADHPRSLYLEPARRKARILQARAS